MKKLLSIMVLGLLLSGNAYAEVLVLDCKYYDYNSPSKAQLIFDLEKKTLTTDYFEKNKNIKYGTEIDIAYNKEEIFYHRLSATREISMFHISRLTGKATIRKLIYDDEFKKKVREKLPVETNKLKFEYPKHTEDELFVLALNNITFNYPAITETASCSKLIKKF